MLKELEKTIGKLTDKSQLQKDIKKCFKLIRSILSEIILNTVEEKPDIEKDVDKALGDLGSTEGEKDE